MVSDLWQRFWYGAVCWSLMYPIFGYKPILKWFDTYGYTPKSIGSLSISLQKNGFFSNIAAKTSIFQIHSVRSQGSQGSQGPPGTPGIPPGQRHPKWPWPPVWSVERHRSASRPRRGWNSAAPRKGWGPCCEIEKFRGEIYESWS